MASPETDTIKGLLQSLEHSLDATDRVSGLRRHLLNAQRDGRRLSHPPCNGTRSN